MILDTSAFMAILQEEPDWLLIRERIEQAATLRIAAPTLVELQVVAASRNPTFLARITSLIEIWAIDVVAFDRELATIALATYLRYGKGFHSRARLNLGDCFSYALARAIGEPLLFVGDDFTHTDIVPALTPGSLS
ncbi:MAG: type II toxin-antitoxin system VapC family toxin [Thermomicrobiales bacterium]